MKKTLAFLSLVMVLAMAMAGAVSAFTLTVPADADVTIVRTVTSTTTMAQYFITTPADNTGGSYVANTAADYTNVEVGGERFLKYTGRGGTLNFRTYLSETGGMGATNIVGYGYMRMRVKVSASQKVKFGIDEGKTSAMLDVYYAVDMSGSLVATANTYNGVTLPADFDGYVYASLEHVTWQGGAVGTRNKDDATPVPSGNNPSVMLDPTAVQRCNNTWTIANGTEVYFGEVALVKSCFTETSVNVAPANINFVLKDSFDTITASDITAAYAGSGAGTAEIVTNGNDKAIAYTATANNSILYVSKIKSFNAYTDNGNTNPYAYAFHVKNTGSASASIGSLRTPTNYSLAPDTAFVGDTLYDMNGNVVAAGGVSVTVPAGFEGYYTLQRNDGGYNNDCSGLLIWISPVGATPTTLVIDDFGYISEEPTLNIGSNVPSKTLNFVTMNPLEGAVDASAHNFAYTAGSDSSAHGELVSAGGNKALKMTWDKAHYSIVKLFVGNGKSVGALDANAYGYGFYVETGAKSVDFWQAQKEKSGATVYKTAELYAADGTYYGPIGSGTSNKTIPANFKGYICIPFDSADKTEMDFNPLLLWFDSGVDGTLILDNFGYFAERPNMANIIGVQYTEVDEGKFSARFVVGMDSLSFYDLEFRYNATVDTVDHWANNQYATVTSAFTTIHVDGMDDVTAEELGYEYLTALTIEDIPATGTIELKVFIATVSESCPTTQLGDGYAYATFTDGAFVSFTK